MVTSDWENVALLHFAIQPFKTFNAFFTSATRRISSLFFSSACVVQ